MHIYNAQHKSDEHCHWMPIVHVKNTGMCSMIENCAIKIVTTSFAQHQAVYAQHVNAVTKPGRAILELPFGQSQA